MAVTSAGEIVVNANQLGTQADLDAIVEYARASGMPVFMGVVVPPRLRKQVLDDMDDAAADIVGRLGPRLLKRRGRRG